MDDKFARRLGYTLLLFYVLVGITYSVFTGPTLHYPDEHSYSKISLHLRQGLGYTDEGQILSAHHPPGYPFFVTLIQCVWSSPVAVKIVQFLLLGLSVWCLHYFFFNQISHASLLLLTILLILYPVWFYTAGTLYPQTLALFLLVLGLGFLCTRCNRFSDALICGGCFGWLILAVPTFGLTILLLTISAPLLKIVKWRMAMLSLVVASVCVGGWTLRNWVTFHEFIPISTNSGENLLLGNNPYTTPTAGATIEKEFLLYYKKFATGMNEFQQDRYYRQCAMEWIRSNPSRAAHLYMGKVISYFSLWNHFYVSSEASNFKQIAMGITYVALLTLLVWRLSDFKRYPLSRLEWLFLFLYVSTAFIQAIFTCRIRYRLPYDFLIITIIAMYLGHRFFPVTTTADSDTKNRIPCRKK